MAVEATNDSHHADEAHHGGGAAGGLVEQREGMMTKTFDAHLYIIDAGWDFADVEYADRHGIGDEDARRIQALAPAHLSAEEREDWAIDAMEALETYCRTARELGHQGAAYDGALAAEALSRRKLIASRFFRRLAAHK